MTRKIPLLFLTIIFWTIAILVTLIGIANAQSPTCPGLALVQVQPGFALNVRTQPGGTGQILGIVVEKSGELRVIEERDGFLRLETGGWIVNKYLSISCWGLGTPMAITVVPSSTATFEATRTPLPTPTRIAAQFIYCASLPNVTEIEPRLWRVECDFR